MINNFKTYARDLLPRRFQVPVKYWYCWLLGSLEPEIKILGLLVGPNDHTIDVGGNRGLYAYHLWNLGTNVEVFEPNPTCCGVLAAWAVGKPAVNVYPVALSSSSGSASLYIPIDDAGIEHDASASIEHTGFTNARDELVPLQTLDSYRFRNIGLIKIDVEGHEYDVINGAAVTLASSKPAILIEIEQRHNRRPIGEIFEKILGFGYQGFFIQIGELSTLDNFDLTRHQTMEHFETAKGRYVNNFIFLHRDRLAAGEYSNFVNVRLLK